MGVTAKGIPRGCQGLFTPVSLGYPLSVFNKNFTFKAPPSVWVPDVIGVLAVWIEIQKKKKAIKNKIKLNCCYGCMLCPVPFVCISAHANVYFKSILRECLRVGLPSGFPSTAPPPVCVSAALGTLAVWIPHQKIKQKWEIRVINNLRQKEIISSTTHLPTYSINELQKRKRKRNKGGFEIKKRTNNTKQHKPQQTHHDTNNYDPCIHYKHINGQIQNNIPHPT